MRKWYVPLTVLGVGGIGAFLLSERGKNVLRWAIEKFRQAPERFLEWNETAQAELDRIQSTLNQIAESLEPHGEPGH